MTMRTLASWDFRGARPYHEKLRSHDARYRLLNEGATFSPQGVNLTTSGAMLRLPLASFPELRKGRPLAVFMGSIRRGSSTDNAWRCGFGKGYPLPSNGGLLASLSSTGSANPVGLFVVGQNSNLEVYGSVDAGHTTGSPSTDMLVWSGAQASVTLDMTLLSTVSANQLGPFETGSFFFIGGPSAAVGIGARNTNLTVMWVVISEGVPTDAERNSVGLYPHRYFGRPALAPSRVLASPSRILRPTLDLAVRGWSAS